MYNIELIDRSTCWKGDKGVVMHCQVRRCWHSLLHPSPDYLITMGKARDYDVTIWGTTEPTIWVKAMDARSGYVDPTIITNTAINEEVRQWLATTDYIGEWKGEADKYKAAIAKVDLPHPPEDVQSEGKYLTYRFVIEGGRGYSIPLVLEVDADSTRVTVGVQEVGNDDRYVHIGTANLSNAVTMENVRCAVEGTLYEFIADLRDVVREVSVYGGWV